MQEVSEGKQLPADRHYKYEELQSRPFVTPESGIPENLLHLFHSFGYDCKRKINLQLLDEKTLIFIAGNVLVLLDIFTKEHRYLRSCSGGGIGCIMVHPDKKYFAAAEKGKQPNIVIYEYPSLQPQRILRGGTERAYSCVDFNPDGSLLASVGGAPDYMLTIWDWRLEEVKLRSNVVSQDAYRVRFSSYNPKLLTSSGCGHINFWNIASTYTGLKLQGNVGKFGSVEVTDIEGFVELPDGKVVSGTAWGNLLLWDRSAVRVEIGREGGRSCHIGTVQPFALEDEQLFTFGSDGAVRGWDFQRISGADSDSGSNKLEIEPLSEIMVGHDVCLSSIVKSPELDSFIWFAQDSGGAIWKIDLSFTHKTLNPECLFSFHGGMIQSLDVSKKSHLMATTSLSRSVKVFDFLHKRELTTANFNQGGTVLLWAPLSVSSSQCLLVVGFEDGVVRLMELYNPEKLNVASKHSAKEEAKLQLKQAFKPHNAAVTAVAYDANGEVLATGGADNTVFFFTVGEKYDPIGFVHVPGAVQALEWSPNSHPEKRLLILCQNGHVVEVHRPDPESQQRAETFLLSGLSRRSFRFRSIKFQIKRHQEISRRQLIKEQQKKERAEEEEVLEEEEEIELPPTPDAPSPLYCGFYSQPGQFWLSMGGFDSGFLYHCKFSESRDEDPDQQQDEPFDFLAVDNADNDPIHALTFSANRQFLLCGMHSGSIRVYPLQPGQPGITSMQAYWTLSVHDNDYGHLRHIKCSHDDQFVLTAGDDGNIFTFSLLPPEELEKGLQRQKTQIPSPREGLEIERKSCDIEDSAAYSIETARQRFQSDSVRQEAELKQQKKLKKLADIQKKYDQVLKANRGLPEHVRLKPEELQLDPRFYELTERLKAERLSEVRREMAWEQERCSTAFNKLQEWFRSSAEANVVTVVGIHSDHRVSTYRLPVFSEIPTQQSRSSSTERHRDSSPETTDATVESADDSSQTEEVEEEVLQPPGTRPRMTLGSRQEERLRKAAERAALARKRIENREQEWNQLYAEKPDGNYEDPQDVQDIQEARENIGDMTLKSDVTMKINLKMMSDRKREELRALEENVYKKQIDMNGKIIALRDSKDRLVCWFHGQAQRLQEVQQHLPVHLRQPAPTPPRMLPEEAPETWLQSKLAALRRYQVVREQRCDALKPDEWDKELDESQAEEEIRLLYEQDCLINKMKTSVTEFDMELKLLRQQKLHLDCKIKLADLHKLLLVQERRLLEQFESRDGCLQEKLTGCSVEENSIASKLEKLKQQMKVKHRETERLQERAKALFTKFKTSLGDEHEYEEFLTKVFMKKIKRDKKELKGKEDEEDSDEDSQEEDDWDEEDDICSLEDLEAAVDDGVCPPGCDPALFEYTLKLREHRLNLEDLLTEEKRSVKALEMERETFSKKEKLLTGCRKAAESDLNLVHRELQQKLNSLDVVVPLRLHQIQYVMNESVPSDLSEALLVHETLLNKLQERIKELQEEKIHMRKLYFGAKQEGTRLERRLEDMNAEIQVLKTECKELMMAKFGKLLDVDALETQAGSRRLEELKLKQLKEEAAHDREVKHWHAKLEEASVGSSETIKRNSELSRSMLSVMEERNLLERQVLSRHKKLFKQQRSNYSRHETQKDIERLEEVVKTQAEQEKTLRREIEFLSSPGSHSIHGQTKPTPSLPDRKPNRPSKHASS
ncbi:cilia- and flagella-associated protein 44-like [Salarias fasciatus]|uniref:cilia- and flagella-associated protein 44-like n=1 Tax=Salarias fasciatus TaxID=181472 RepID=UPI001176D273|nr:cilia- and flagella-associated protein 44-like [Salarias fasciatus]